MRRFTARKAAELLEADSDKENSDPNYSPALSEEAMEEQKFQ